MNLSVFAAANLLWGIDHAISFKFNVIVIIEEMREKTLTKYFPTDLSFDQVSVTGNYSYEQHLSWQIKYLQTMVHLHKISGDNTR